MSYNHYMKRIFVTVLAICFATATLWAQAEVSISVTQNTSQENLSERPSVALVLAGGGARGFVHIAVLELLEELSIPIDMVVGTSAGAIVGGLYSAGYTPQEIADSLLYLDWISVFQDESVSPFERALDGHSTSASPFALQFNKNLSIDLGKGLFTGQKAYELLKSLTVKIPSYIDFDSLPTPFRAATVDLLTGDLIIMEQGDLAEAMRASMSLPAFFEPFIIDGRYYIDGVARDNLPIQAAHDMGYDIIIAVEISQELVYDVNRFASNPITVLTQMTAMQQSIRGTDDYKLADLVLFPDVSGFGIMDYPKAEDIYERGKAEATLYRSALLELREKIYPELEKNAELLEESMVVNGGQESNQTQTFIFVEDSMQDFFTREGSYKNLEYTTVNSIVLTDCVETDKKYILNAFEKIKNEELTSENLLSFLATAYNTGNYLMVIPRIDIRNGQNQLEILFVQKTPKKGLLLFGSIFEGTVASDSSIVLNLSTDLQFRGLSGPGSAFSIKLTFVNDLALQMLYLQPIGPKTFMQVKMGASSEHEFFSSGFSEIDITGTEFQQADISVGFGILFNPKHSLVTQTGVHWIDTSRARPDSMKPYFDAYPDSKVDFTTDFSLLYTFSNLDYLAFPTQGFYSATEVMGVIPLQGINAPPIFERITTDFTAAIPLGKHFTIVFNTFFGTIISEELKKAPPIIPVYGFNLNDRRFFPQISGKHEYGLHKVAIRLGIQLQPWDQLTILGGQIFFGMSGTAGGVWSDYASLRKIDNLQWRISLETGLRIKNTFSIALRAGAGTSGNKISPFISLDFGNLRY